MYFLRLSLKSCQVKFFLSSNVPNSQFDMNAASLVSVCFPLPPTPTMSALPLGYLRILEILEMCSKHSGKRTKSSLLTWSMLSISSWSILSILTWSVSHECAITCLCFYFTSYVFYLRTIMIRYTHADINYSYFVITLVYLLYSCQ